MSQIQSATRKPVRASSTARTQRTANAARTPRETATQFMRSISNVPTAANPNARFDPKASAAALDRSVTFRDPLLKLEGRGELLKLLKVYNDPRLKPQYDFKIIGQKGDRVQAVWKTEYKFNGWDRFPVKNELTLDMTVKNGKITDIRQSYDVENLARQTVQAVAPITPFPIARRAMSVALRAAMRLQR